MAHLCYQNYLTWFALKFCLGNKLSEDCCKYGVENGHDEILGKAATIYGDACKYVEKVQEDLNRMLFSEDGCLHNWIRISMVDNVAVKMWR